MCCGEREQWKKHVGTRHDCVLEGKEIGEREQYSNDSRKRAVPGEKPASRNRAQATNPTQRLVRKMKPVVGNPKDRGPQWRVPLIRQLMEHEVAVAQVAAQQPSLRLIRPGFVV